MGAAEAVAAAPHEPPARVEPSSFFLSLYNNQPATHTHNKTYRTSLSILV